jgi:hypothetical protein
VSRLSKSLAREKPAVRVRAVDVAVAEEGKKRIHSWESARLLSAWGVVWVWRG